MMWLWISLSYATFGLRIIDDRVAEAAPIARWMIGFTVQQVWDYCASRRDARFAWVGL
jgi:hypothetical protein